MLPADATGPVTVPSKPIITPPKQDKPFQKELDDAKSATNKANNTRKDSDVDAANEKWAVVQGMVQYDYLLASLSDDPAKETQKLDEQYKTFFRGHSQSTEIYDDIVADSKKAIQNAPLGDRKAKYKVFEAEQKIADAEKALKGASDEEEPNAQAAYTTAITDYLNLLIDGELKDMKSGGPGGTYTPAQWKEAGDNVKLMLGLKDDQAKLVDLLAVGRGKIDDMVDTIKNDPGSLGLSSKEQELAKVDPVTLAVLQLSGVNVNYDKLSDPEKEIFDADPVLWGFMQKGGVNITDGTDALPVIEVNGEQLKLDDKTRKVLQMAYEEGGAAGVASMLQQLGIVKSDKTLGDLLPATAPARMEFTTTEVDRLMKEGKDVEALKVLGVNTGSAQSKAEHDAIMHEAGDQYFGPGTDYWSKQVDKQLALPDDEDPFTMANNDADKVGRWMQEVGKNAPPELVRDMLQTVMTRFGSDWLKGNGTRAPISTDGTDFYKGLSLAVDVSDQLEGTDKWAVHVAKWLVSQPVGETSLIGLMATENGTPIKDTIVGGFGMRLSDALMTELKDAKKQENGRSYKNAQGMLSGAVEQGKEKQGELIAQAKYDAFMKNKDKILQSFFDQFLDEKNLGKSVAIANTPETRNLIGTALDLPTNANDAEYAKRDNSVDWYADNTDSRIIIDTVITWLTDQSRTEDGRTDGATFVAAPLVHVSPHLGVQTGAFFEVTRADGTKRIVDGTVAEDIYEAKGKGFNPLDVAADWHFDDLEHFQDKNEKYDPDGKIFLPKNMRLSDGDGDGHVERADWMEIRAANTTFLEHLETKGMSALSIVGTGLMFTPFAAVGLGIVITTGVVGVGVSIWNLSQMDNTGQSRGLDNPNARLQYMNIVGSISGMGRVGILRLAGTSGRLGGFAIPGAARFGAWASAGRGVTPLTRTLGFIATYTGLNLVISQGQYLVASAASGQWGWDQMLALGALSAGGGQMIMGAVGFTPRSTTTAIVGSPRQTGIAAFKFWRKGNPPAPTGMASSVWTDAWSKFKGDVLDPAYQQWISARSLNKPGDQYFVTAVDDFKSRIDADARASNPTPTQADLDRAQANLSSDISLRAHELWVEGGRKKSGSATIFWSKTGRTAEKDFYKNIGVRAHTFAQAEGVFLKTIGADSYNAWVKADRPADPYFDQAIAAKAADIKTATGKANPTPDELVAAQDTLGQDIGVEAYKAWRGDMKGITAAQFAKGEREVLGQPAYVKWARANRPTDPYFNNAIAEFSPKITEAAKTKFKVTSPSREQLRKAQDEMAGPIGARAYQLWADDGRPTTATTATYWLEAEQKFAAPAYHDWKRSGEVRYGRTTDLPMDQNWERAVTSTAAPPGKEANFAGEIGFKSYDSWRSQGRPGETTARQWQLAEKRFRLAVGEGAYHPWARAGRPLGGDGSYFTNTPESFHQKVGKWAYDYWSNNREKYSAATEVHWRNAERTRDTAVGRPAFDEWDAASRPAGGTWWYDAISSRYMQTKITTEAQTLAGRDPAGVQNPVTQAHVTKAEQNLAAEIGSDAYLFWVEAGRPRGPATPTAWVKAEADFDSAIGLGAFNVWDAAARPTDKGNKIWRAAPYMAREGGPTADHISFAADKRGAKWADRRADSSTTLRVRGGEYWQQAKGYLKWLGLGWAAINVAGGVAEVGYHFGLNEKRTSGDIADPNEELKKYIANPDSYLEDNYTNELFGGENTPIVGNDLGAKAYNFKGHLFAFTEEDGTVTYFRRLPEDLYNALKDNPNPQGYTVKGNTITLTESIKLDEVGDFAIADGDPMGEQVDDSIKRRIGFDAYINWLGTDMSTTVPGSTAWTQAYTDFHDKVGKPAYEDWVATGRPMTGDNTVWALAKQDSQVNIDKRANEIWKQSGGRGSGPTAAQIDTAEAEFGADIGTRAYKLWTSNRNKENWVASNLPTKDDDSVWALAKQDSQADIDKRANDLWKQSGGQGSGPTQVQISQAEAEFKGKIETSAYEFWAASNRNTKVVGFNKWVKGEQDILYPKATEGFDSWVSAGRPDVGKEAIWTPALDKWSSDKRPVDIDVDLRPPYRVNFGQEELDGANGWGDEGDGPGFSWKPNLSIGPVEGLRPHFDTEVMFGAPYNQPTVSTVRLGVGSSTNPWGLGLRQQDTRMLARINFSFGTLDNNKAKVHDLTSPDSFWSGSEFMVYNGRFYLDIGNRNRARVDMNKGSKWFGKPGSVYIRQRETAFLELGLGADFVRRNYGDNESWSLNGYYELQFYPFDYRNQITWKPGGGNDWLTNTQGMQQFPLFEIDPALQFSWTNGPQIQDFSPDEDGDYWPGLQNEVS